MTFGTPVSSRWNGNYREIIWYGGDARGYVTLEYDYSAGRYYTILSYGIWCDLKAVRQSGDLTQKPP